MIDNEGKILAVGSTLVIFSLNTLQAFIDSKQCKAQCINKGRYCAPDPEQDFTVGYDGKQVVVENLRQLCVYKVTNDSKMSWKWWDYVTDFQIRCPMKEKKYGPECAEEVLKSLCNALCTKT